MTPLPSDFVEEASYSLTSMYTLVRVDVRNTIFFYLDLDRAPVAALIVR